MDGSFFGLWPATERRAQWARAESVKGDLSDTQMELEVEMTARNIGRAALMPAGSLD